MRLLITGASGFIGQAVVRVAAMRGHEVRALVRRPDALGPNDLPSVQLVVGDVRTPVAWADALDGCDAVLHLAAAFGDFADQFATTVVGTERLLDSMVGHGVAKIVLASTFSVYDYDSMAVGAVLDEASPIENRPNRRDDYAKTKLVQEQLVRDAAAAGRVRAVILRPGAVYGPSKTWNGGLAGRVGGVGIALAPSARQKLVHVDSCAEAFVLAAEAAEAEGGTFNLVDDDGPTQRSFAAELRAQGHDVPRGIPVPYRLAEAVASLVGCVNRVLLGGRAKVPGIVVRERLAAQFKPLEYDNEHAKKVLGWVPMSGVGPVTKTKGHH